MDYHSMTTGELRTQLRELRKTGRVVGTGMQIAGATAQQAILVLEGTCNTVTAAVNLTNGTQADTSELEVQNQAPTPAPAPRAPAGDVNAAAAALAAALAGQTNGVDASEVLSIVMNPANELMAEVKKHAEKAAAAVAPRRVEIQHPDGRKVDVGTQHKNFEALIKWLGIGRHVMLVGNAGTGKSYGVYEAARALSRDYHSLSVGPMTSKSDLVGYMDANGTYRASSLRRAYENGGVFLLDEMDAANPAVLTTMNAMLSGEVYDFPDAQLKKHEHFVVVGAANTVGKGADRIFVGRQQLDGATLNRFVNMSWDYDTALESALLGSIDAPDKKKWIKMVDDTRKKINTHKVRHIAGFRNKQFGVESLMLGFTMAETVDSCLRQGLDENNWNLIKPEGA